MSLAINSPSRKSALAKGPGKKRTHTVSDLAWNLMNFAQARALAVAELQSARAVKLFRPEEAKSRVDMARYFGEQARHYYNAAFHIGKKAA